MNELRINECDYVFDLDIDGDANFNYEDTCGANYRPANHASWAKKRKNFNNKANYFYDDDVNDQIDDAYDDYMDVDVDVDEEDEIINYSPTVEAPPANDEDDELTPVNSSSKRPTHPESNARLYSLDLNQFNVGSIRSTHQAAAQQSSDMIIYKGNNQQPSKMNRILKSVNELPSQYRNIFKSFPYFNYIQSTVFDDVMYTNRSMVISAPTSSGKTVILELAIVRLLTSLNYCETKNKAFNVIYMAPLKALCSEKYNEWSEKFEKLHGLKCVELTGDSEQADDEAIIENANIICTTPEKWDIMTRKFKKRSLIMNRIKLFLIDEIHVLGENSRGAIIEAVISRMKTFAYSNSIEQNQQQSFASSKHDEKLRFIGVSATIPNIDDFASWLSTDDSEALIYKINENYRPVKLKKVVLGYYCSPKMNDYCFDLSLNYKLSAIVREYSNGKPTLIFCSTRKSCQQAAQQLAKENQKYIRSSEHLTNLRECSMNLKDSKLAELIVHHGVGYHHAGMDSKDRHLIENLFLKSNLLVLCSTSTLAIGVNLPAHLVIIKSTMYYSSESSFTDYSISQILQMIGRAGRPQFDRSATAVIMTKKSETTKYETFIEGNQLIESQLHKSLIEHLNVEIVLRTITNLNSAINWLKSTYLYTRLRKNPAYYGICENEKNRIIFSNTSQSQNTCSNRLIDDYLRELLVENLNSLMEVNLIEKCDFDLDPTAELNSTQTGILMARYCLAFDTMKSIVLTLAMQPVIDDCDVANCREIVYKPSTKSLDELISLISSSKEFEDIKLRTNEKSILNALNNNGKPPKTNTAENIIRFILNGKIKTHQMKVNVLIQSHLGSIQINDFSLNQDIFRIFRVAQRISKCLLEYLSQNIKNKSAFTTAARLDNSVRLEKNYETFINAAILYKCISVRMWYDSPHLFMQFTRVGMSLSQLFVKNNLTSFEKVLKIGASDLEKLLNKPAPYGKVILETIEKLPKYAITFESSGVCCDRIDSYTTTLDIKCTMLNWDYIRGCENAGTLGFSLPILFIVGDEKNNLLCSQKLNNSIFLHNNGLFTKKIHLNSTKNGMCVHASLVLLSFVGLDVHESFSWNQNLELNDQNDDDESESVQQKKPKKICTKKKSPPENHIPINVQVANQKSAIKRKLPKDQTSIDAINENDNNDVIEVPLNSQKSTSQTSKQATFTNQSTTISNSSPDSSQDVEKENDTAKWIKSKNRVFKFRKLEEQASRDKKSAQMSSLDELFGQEDAGPETIEIDHQSEKSPPLKQLQNTLPDNQLGEFYQSIIKEQTKSLREKSAPRPILKPDLSMFKRKTDDLKFVRGHNGAKNCPPIEPRSPRIMFNSPSKSSTSNSNPNSNSNSPMTQTKIDKFFRPKRVCFSNKLLIQTSQNKTIEAELKPDESEKQNNSEEKSNESNNSDTNQVMKDTVNELTTNTTRITQQDFLADYSYGDLASNNSKNTNKQPVETTTLAINVPLTIENATKRDVSPLNETSMKTVVQVCKLNRRLFDLLNQEDL